ncbi:MAG: type II 3-dehydroquinate dehydratase, partial [Desulfococcaceae bacterium]
YREAFLHISMISDLVTAQMAGFGHRGYFMALSALSDMIQKKSHADS